LLLALLGAVACASPVRAPVEPPYGGLFSLYTAPLVTNFDATPVGSKVGINQIFHVELPLYARIPLATFADSSIQAAAEQGGIQRIYYADYQVLSVLGIFVRLTVRVSGD